MKDDDVFRKADIYVYSYPSPFLQRSYKLDEVIEHMHAVLDKDAVFRSHEEVVFLCHSMGGLIVRGYLKRYQKDALKVPLIYFFSTPTDGAHITRMAHLLSSNPQLGGMLPLDSNDYLESMQRDWRAMTVPIFSKCAYEVLDTMGVRIVDERSASSLCDGPVTPLLMNHIDIVKPKSSDDLNYSVFQRAFDDRPLAPGKPLEIRNVLVTRPLKPGQRITVVIPRTGVAETPSNMSAQATMIFETRSTIKGPGAVLNPSNTSTTAQYTEYTRPRATPPVPTVSHPIQRPSGPMVSGVNKKSAPSPIGEH